ncbi:MAG: hypothetical protein ABH873_03110 [Candidatus Firestonebacteria bacterium]
MFCKDRLNKKTVLAIMFLFVGLSYGGPATHFTVVTQNGGTETVGIAFSVTLTAKDISEQTDTSYTGTHSITWTWTATNSPNNTPPTKPANGNQTFISGVVTVPGWTLTNAGQTPTISATAGTVNGTSATITVNPGNTSRFRVETEHNGTETVGSSFSVTLTATDIYGNTTPTYTGTHSITWTWTATDSPNNTSPTKPANGDQTFTNGVSTIPGFTLTNAGQTPTITAQNGAIIGTSNAIIVNVSSSNNFTVSTQNGNVETAGISFSVTLIAKDICGNITPTYTGTHSITWTWTATDSPNNTSPTKPANGDQTFTNGVSTRLGFILTNTGETPTISASDGSIGGISNAITVNSASANSFTITSPTPVTAGSSFSITNIIAKDLYGNISPTYNGSKTLAYSGPGNSLYGNTPTYSNPVNFVSGVATNISTTLVKVETVSIHITQSTVSGDSNSIIVDPNSTNNFQVVTQNGNVETAGSPFSVTLTAKDIYGNTTPAYTGTHSITWTWTATNSPNNTPPTKPSDGNQTFTNGVATVPGFTLTNASQTPTISASDGSNIGTSGPITVNSNTASSFTVVTQNNNIETAGNSFSVTLTAKDAYGNVAISYTGSKFVTWTWTATNSPNNTPPTKPSDGNQTFTNGVATVLGFTLTNTGETPTITATTTITGTSPLITVNPANATSFTITSPTPVTAGISFNITDITAKDSYGNIVIGYNGVKTLVYGGPGNSPFGNLPTYTTSVTFTSGVATNIPTTLVKAEVVNINVTQITVSGTSNSVTVNPNSANNFSIVAPVSVYAGIPFDMTTITCCDIYGNTITSYSGSKTLVWSGPGNGPEFGNPSYTNPVNFANGVASIISTTLVMVEIVAIHIVEGLIAGDSNLITVNAGTGNSFAVTTEHNNIETAGISFYVTLRAKDIYGNTATGYAGVHSITWTWTATNSPYGHLPIKPANGNQNFTNGIVNVPGFTLTNASETPTISASDSLINGTSPLITVNPGNATSFTITSPTPVTAGVSFNITNITAKDTFGNIATTYNGSKNLSYSGPGNSPFGNSPTYTTPVNFTNGVVINIPTTLVRAEAVNINVTQITVSGTSNLITVNPNVVSKFSVVTEHNGVEIAGVTFSVVLSECDAYGNPVAGYTGSKSIVWTWTATNSPNNTPPTKPSDGNQTFTDGVSTVPGWTLTNAGETPTITATGGLLNGTSFPITVNGHPTMNSFVVTTQLSGTETAGVSFSVNLMALDVYANTSTFTGTTSVTWTWTATNSPNNTPPTKPADGDCTFVSGLTTKSGFILVDSGETPTIVATSGSVNGISSPIIVLHGTPSTFSFTAPPNVTVGISFIINPITVYDAYSNLATSYSGPKALVYSGPGNSPFGNPPTYTTSVNFTAGASTTILTTILVKVESVAIHITEVGISGDSNSINVAPNSATNFNVVIQNNGIETAGISFSVTLTARDNEGNTAISYTGFKFVTWTWPATNSPNNTPPTKPTDGNQIFTNGVSTVSGFILTNAGETPTITATTTITGTSPLITVNSSSATSFVIISPTPVTAGVPFNITSITAKDIYGNIAKAYVGLKTLTYSGPSGTPTYTNSVNFANGVATTILATTLVVAETIQIHIVEGSVSGDSNLITVGSSSVSYFSLSLPDVVYVGIPFNMTTLVARDGSGNVATEYSGVKTLFYSGPLSGLGGSPAYTTSVNFTNGLATTPLTTTLFCVETTKITVIESSISGVSNQFSVRSKPGMKIYAVSDPSTIKGAGWSATILVSVSDENDSPLVNQWVTAEITQNSGGTIITGFGLTNNDGQITGALTSGSIAGENIIRLKTENVTYDLEIKVDLTPSTTSVEIEFLGFNRRGVIYVKENSILKFKTTPGNGLPVAKIYYKIDNTPNFVLYEGPFNINNTQFDKVRVGKHTIYFYSVDTGGNIEPIKSATFYMTSTMITSTSTNYPNPFAAGREKTTIEYYLDEDANVDLKIHDLFGHLVWRQEFLIGELGGMQGTNLVFWDGANGSGEIVANGGYICYIMVKASSGTTVLKRKIGVVK